MSVVLSPPTKRSRRGVSEVKRKRWTVEDYHRAIDNGAFRPDERLELLRGEIVEKMPQGTEHATGIMLTQEALRSAFRVGFIVRSQLPLTLPKDSEPEPDVLVAIGGLRTFESRHPGPEDVKLIVEISNSTMVFDTVDKASRYAQDYIPELWVLDLKARKLLVFREPISIKGAPYGFGYSSVTEYAEEEAAAPLAAPEVKIRVMDLLPSSSLQGKGTV